MTEAEWDRCTDPQKMLEFLRDTGRAGERRSRLFMVGCCRQLWRLFTDEGCRRAVVVAEWDMDGLTNKEVFGIALRGVACDWMGGLPTPWGAQILAARAALTGGRDRTRGGRAGGLIELTAVSRAADLLAFISPAPDEVRRKQAALLRDIFGPLPFRLLTLAPHLLGWNDGTLVKLAQAVYEDRSLPEGTLDGSRLAILADALEDAGCDNEDILAHCRQGGIHVRGCWVIDCLLAKN